MSGNPSYVRPAGQWDGNAAPRTGADRCPANDGGCVEPVFTHAVGVYGDGAQAERNAAMRAEADAAHRYGSPDARIARWPIALMARSPKSSSLNGQTLSQKSL